MAIELRTNKASALTYSEMDRNFSSFFYSASVDNGNILKLWYTGSTTLNTGGEDFGPARFIPIDLQPTTGAVPTLTVAGDPRAIQFRHSTNPVLDADNGFLYNTALQLGIGASIPAANAKIHARGTNTVPATLRLESTTNNGTNRRATVDFYQGTVLYGTIGRHDPFDPNMYIKSWAPTGKFAVDSDPGHIRFVVGNNANYGAFTQTGFGIGTFLPQHLFHADGNGYFAGRLGVGTGPGAAALHVFQTAQTGTSLGDFETIAQFGIIPGGSVDSLKILSVRQLAGGNNWWSNGMRIQQDVDGTYRTYIQFSGEGNMHGFSIGTGQSTSPHKPGDIGIEERLRIDSYGNVSINKPVANAKFDVNGDTIVTGSFTTTGNATIKGTATVDFSLTTGTTAAVGTNLSVGGKATILDVPASAESSPRILTVSQTSPNVGRVEYITNIVPKGAIMMWGGLAQNSTTPPPGWRLCDGDNSGNTNGVTIPDLRERFIVGAGGNNPGVVTKNYETAQFDLQPSTFFGTGTISLPLNSLANGVYNVVTTGVYHHTPASIVVEGPIGGNLYGERFFVYQKTAPNPYYLIYSTMVSNYILVRGTFAGAGTIPNFLPAPTTGATTAGYYFTQPTTSMRGVADYGREINGTWVNGKRPDHAGFYYYDTLGYSVGDRGGFNEVQMEVAQMPPHRHTNEGFLLKSQSTPATIPWYNWGFPNVTDKYATNQPIGQTGGYLPHENRPPYYALAFIIYTGV